VLRSASSQTGNSAEAILRRKPEDWDGFFAALEGTDIPDDFLGPAERAIGAASRDPFEDWSEVDKRRP
jgi:antitoxin VapB